MEWTKYDCAAFSLEHPVGWQVRSSPGPMMAVISPAGDVFALVEAFAMGAGDTPASVLEKRRFPSAKVFGEVRAEPVMPGPGGSVNMFLNYRTHTGVPGRARVGCVQSGGMISIFTSAAPADQFAAIESVLVRILMSFRPTPAGAVAGAAAQQQQTAQPPPLPMQAGAGGSGYIRFTEPQMGTFSVEVPAGWKMRGGLNHPALGDRRTWVEVMSPEGIYVLNGDPEFPQSFCHFPGNAEGTSIVQTGGAPLLNFTPSADRIADYYLKNVATKRFGPFVAQPRRQRPDVVELVRGQWARQKVAVTKSTKLWAVENLVQISQGGQQRIGSLLVTAAFSGQYTLGTFTFWGGGTFLYVAPPELAGRAEAVRWHMIESYQNTPRMQQVVQKDEALITQAGNAANAAQWQWFAGQQAQHQAQVAFGDAIVDNYWQRQQSNDAMVRGWEQSQAVNDQVSQARSDEILDRQRLADDGMGKSYEAPAGHNYYWLDQQTGQIVGTNTSDPPDLTRNYSQLRKL